MKKQPEVRERSREAIFNAFFAEYQETQLRGITVGAVAKRAQVNRSTFYEYFSDIYDLIDQAEEALLAKLMERINQLKKQPLSEQPPLFAAYGEEIILEHGDRLAILLSHGDTGFFSKIKQVVKPVIANFFPIDTTSPEAELLVSFILSGIIGYITTWYKTGKPVSIHEMVTTLQAVMRYSLTLLVKDTAITNN